VTVPVFSMWRRCGYALCNVGTAIAAAPAQSLLLFFMTQVLGLAPGLAGVIVALPKVWDALVDPMLGGWLDRTSLRLGRRGPVTLASGAGYLVCMVLIFALHPVQGSQTEVALAVTVLLMIYSTSQTGLGVTQYALATEMTDGPVALSKLLSMAAVAAQVLAVVFAALAPMLVVWSGGGATGYSRMAIEVAGASGLALLTFYFATRKVPVITPSAEASTLPLLRSIRLTWTNRSFYFLIAFVMFVNAGAGVLFSFLPFANHYVLGGSSAGLSTLEAVLGISVLVGMLASPLAIRRKEPLTVMRWSNALVGASLGAMFLASFGPLWTTWLALAVLGLASGVIGVLVQTATLTAARLKMTGAVVVALGFYLGIMLAGIKLGSSLGGLASGQLLQAIGFVSGGASQSESTLFWLRTGYSLVPMFFTVAAGLCLHRVILPGQGGRPAEASAVLPPIARGLA